MIKILIADDHVIVRKGLVEILRDEFTSAVFTEASNSAEVFNLTKNEIRDLIILDISMPGQNGIEVLKQLRANGIKAPVLMLSMHPEEQYAIRALKSGASGYLNKTIASEELVTAVQKILSGKRYITSSLAEKLAMALDKEQPENPHDLLSDRELQVFKLLAAGKTVSEIADEISLSVNTISTYRTRILEKLSLNNTAELMRYAVENRLG